jgi:hypothetical protein
MGIIREPEGIDFVIEPHEVTEEEYLAMLALIAAHKERKKEMAFDKKAIDNLDLEVDPRGFTEEDKIAVRAYIAACKEREKQQQKEIKKRKRSHEPLAANYPQP